MAAGCSHKPTVVGTWTGTRTLPGGFGSQPSSITLRDDGTFTTQVGTQAGASGTYTVKDNTLTETYTSYVFNGQARAIPPQAAVTQVGTFELKDDTMTLTSNDGSPPATLTRKKD